jgi:DNA-directed RNA polymerase subunit L
MEIKILKEAKDEMEVELDSLTIPEVLRIYLNKDPTVTFVAWRRNHPTSKPILLVKTKGKTVKKAISDAIASLEKELDKLDSDFKKVK